MIRLIVALQIGGFVVALAGLFVHSPGWYFLGGFGVHVIGDILYLRKEGF